MKLLDVAQGSPEWHAARLGIPTASAFHRIITARSGKPSASAERYLWELLAERLLGVPMDAASSGFMERGSGLEQDAVHRYELQHDCDAVKVGFVLRDDGRVGCSPDRLVGEDGILEIKCCSAPVHVGALLGATTDEHRAQCQGQLWLTGRAWVDLYHYHPDLPPALVRVERDEEYIAALAGAVESFLGRLDEAAARLSANRGTP